MPASITIKMPMMMVSARRACLGAGSRNAITPLLTASTPVMAVHPLAKARTSSHALTLAVARVAGGIAATAIGWPLAASVLASPIAIAVSKQAMNRYVGSRN